MRAQCKFLLTNRNNFHYLTTTEENEDSPFFGRLKDNMIANMLSAIFDKILSHHREPVKRCSPCRVCIAAAVTDPGRHYYTAGTCPQHPDYTKPRPQLNEDLDCDP